MKVKFISLNRNEIISIVFKLKVHTNPILLCFISILYYKHLDEHIYMYRLEKCHMMDKLENDEYISLKKFNGRLASIDQQRNEKNYNKTIVNRWNVALTLHYNKCLIKYRKHNIKQTKENFKVLSCFQSVRNKSNLNECVTLYGYS